VDPRTEKVINQILEKWEIVDSKKINKKKHSVLLNKKYLNKFVEIINQQYLLT
jgi:hypothetical protein